MGLPRRPRGIPEAEVGARWTTPRSSPFGAWEKRFPGVRALEEVSFDISRGSCHALCGENGAGKSTLGKLLAGIDVPDGGEILLDGRPVRFESPRDALAAGVGMVHQELAFCENMSVAENLCLGSLPRRGPFVDRPAVARRGRQLLEAIEATIDVHRLVGELTVAEQQVVQIASAVGGGARVIIFDEPTSSLSEQEADHLYALMGRLRERGVTCVYVSHRMPEIFRLCDTITVLRDGRHVTTQPARALDEAALVELMIGRRLDLYLPKQTPHALGDVILRVDKLSSPGKFHDVSFEVRAGEIVGLAGLVGAGRTDVAKAIFGLDAAADGRVEVAGQPLPAGSPIAAMQAGLGLVPEDRKRQGFIPQLSGNQNLALPVLPQLARWGWLPGRRGARAGRGGVWTTQAAGAESRSRDGGAVGGQPAEDRLREMAGRALPAPDPRRADPRRGRGRQIGNPFAHSRSGGSRDRDPSHLQ